MDRVEEAEVSHRSYTIACDFIDTLFKMSILLESHIDPGSSEVFDWEHVAAQWMKGR